MNSLRQLLLVAVLLFAQLAAGVHAVGHAADDEGGPATKHACELCLAAHDLGAALPSLAALPQVLAPLFVPELLLVYSRAAFPPPVAHQRGPPIS